MGLFDRAARLAEMARALTPEFFASLASEPLGPLLDREVARARATVDELAQRYPSAGVRELSQRLVDDKKQLAAMVGGITGVFGMVTVPVDLVAMAWLQLTLVVEVATVYKVSLKGETARQELLDLLAHVNGVGPLERSSPRVLGTVAAWLLRKGGMKALGRAVPLVAAPVSAWLNNRHVQAVGDAAVRHYEGWGRAHEKAKRASGG